MYLSGNDCIFQQEITSKILTEYFHNNRKHKRGIKKSNITLFEEENVHCSYVVTFQLYYLEASLCFLLNRSLLILSVSTTVSMNYDARFTAQKSAVEDAFICFTYSK